MLIFNPLIYLAPNTANQTVYLSLYEGRYTLANFTPYMLLIEREENTEVGVRLAQVPTIVSDGSRITQLTVTTVGLELSGRYRYTVYGQNSSSNTDETDASVVGVVEIGYIEMTDSNDYFQVVETPSDNGFIAH